MFNIQSYFKIKKILRKEKPDLVMTHNLTGVGFLTPLAIHRSRRVKESNPAIPRDWIPRYMHTLHDIQLLHPSGLMLVGKEKKVDGLFARVYQWYNKKLFASLDIVISPSEWLMKMHADRGFFQKAKCVVMANSVNTSPSPSLVRRGDDDGKFIFLYVGQIEKHKGVELLIKEFIKLQRDNSELWIVGEGGESEKLEVRSKKLGINARIKFLGKKNYDEIRGLMQKANCLVVPSLCYENQPTVIIEARQNNLPVIASDIGGIPEILKPEFLFKAGDREELIKKMKWVMENYDRVKKMQSVETQVPTFAQDYIEKLLKL
ncbi:hypothetical protein A2477_01235 [Candidatus Falkowbacteria bacterium RIFOXYC2_FULL_47_12]|uniref:Glycosyl transferase family 1 domain-containing protein n=2 Tax=Candidatus Falkowiibacteriota TaxID=1752728 RepID=A0A1F5TLI6_9BACT|nr:MAG: hypothetical protein A2242_02600 [Candidatus Falkowbacteria bacterium RIFOXYA2_FULL_47_9]OGF39778.1 MAG: hypothetical protein A2477_01235 [Candidatus Falkowbacteria bacterium RIFOXYC2_FULL_47_12]